MDRPEHPLLVFPSPAKADREKRPPGGGKLKIPGSGGQAKRIAPQFQRLQAALDKRKAALQSSAAGTQPEQVLVIETVGSVQNFVKAVQKVEGLEWLGELELDEIAPEFEFQDEKKPEKLLKGQLFLVMTDQAALKQIRSLFKQWRSDPDRSFPRGLAPLKQAFVHLHTIRPWDEGDRIRETGLVEDWQERREAGQEIVPFEAELWFRKDRVRRGQGSTLLREMIGELGGEVVQQCVIPEIGYHGILGRVPIEHAERIAAMGEVRLLQCEDVMHLRPVGQCAILLPEEATPSEDGQPDGPVAQTPPDFTTPHPIVALFDGLPLTRHEKLNGRLHVDDPDGFEEGYEASSRVHGTAMASMICHGDLAENQDPVAHPIYARPILRPYPRSDGRTWEGIPEDVLPVDLLHRAVRRLFESEGDEPPAAPGVRIINLSVGDSSRMLDRGMSPWARVLDWLSWKYSVLFVVSAGNHSQDIELDVAREDFANLSDEDREKKTIEALVSATRHRRLLSPSESFNAITVGALHADISIPNHPNLLNPFTRGDLPATYSAQGFGYRRSIKPDILLPGGRQFFREKLGNTHAKATLQANQFVRPPGQEVATPGSGGDLSATHFTRGTSNAAALASRAAAEIYEVLEFLRSQPGAQLPHEYDAVLLKALLVHGASWGAAYDLLESVLKNPNNSRAFKTHVSRFLGYGSADLAKAITCTAQRATVLGVGQLSDGEGQVFTFPLPPCLSAVAQKRRLTITLAYLTPINGANQNYRVAHLWFNPKNSLAPTRQEADHRAVQRGTVQHEILEGQRAADYQEGETLAIKVNCREDAGTIGAPVRYAITVTLEVAEGLELAIYQEVENRLAVPVPIRSGASS